jgi:Tetratricopeptide repeat/NB-ARC domain
LAGASRFVGRTRDLWQVHSALHGAESAIITATTASGLAQVSGMGGVGKSLLAEEYALRFGAAYPGGVFWLRAMGHDVARPAAGREHQDAVRSEQFHHLAVALGIDVAGLSPPQVEAVLRAAFEKAGQSFLWVVDDLAAGLDGEAVRAWLPPHPLGKTLVTTRSREYGSIGTAVPLGVLRPEEAFDLVCVHRQPEPGAETAAAHRLVEDLGHHPLAVDVAGAALQAEAGLVRFAEFRERLGDPRHDELEFAGELADVLPSGHEKSIAATLLRSVRSLPEDGRDFLRLASLLAVAPIPVRLVAATFARADKLDEGAARRRAALALKQADAASLAEHAGDDARAVHTLISRAVRFHDPDARRSVLRRAVIDALAERLPGVVDIRAHQELALDVLHARELCAQGADSETIACLGAWVGHHDFVRGAYASARHLQEQVLAVSRRVLGEEHPDTLGSMHNFAETLRAQGDLAGARALQEQVLAVSRRVLGEEHPDTITSMSSLAVTLDAQGDLAGARALHEQVLAVRRRVLGEEHPGTLTSMSNLAVTLDEQGDLAGARALKEQVLAVLRRVLGEEHPDTLTSMSNLAVTLDEQGDLAGARALEDKVVAVRRRVPG